jgi:geranylgeranyl pyrophosphate synthase
MSPEQMAAAERAEAKPLVLGFGSGSGLTLPAPVPKQKYRPAQSNIPDERRDRLRIQELAARRVRETGVVPPLGLLELREHAAAVLDAAGLDRKYENYAAILVSNASWHDTLATIPYERRLLLLPKCLRIEEKCPAPFDQFGLLCKECGLCSIQDLTVEAERLGYAVLVAEGSAIVRQMIETGKIDAVVGVSCINVLEKCFPHLESAAVPGMAVPLLQDDCINTTVDLDAVWDLIHLSSDDRTFRLDLDALKKEVQSWFEPASLQTILGVPQDPAARLAHEWLAKAGNRWRPYLAACAYMALQDGRHDAPPPAPPELKALAVAVECFHKASLVHDDIEDGDAERYGEDTLHVREGVPAALNAGDYLLGEGYRLLSELPVDPAIRVKLLKTASEGHLLLSRGQGVELDWARRPRVLGSLEVLEIFRQKTAPAFEVALRLGAFLGEADADTHETLRKYSESVGIAYQIKDDLEDAAAGGGDLEKRRPSLLLAIGHKRAAGGAEKAAFEALVEGRRGWAELGPEILRLLRERGAIEKAGELLEAYKQDAIRSLRWLDNPTLKGLLRRVVGKIFGERLIEGYCSEFEARNAAGRPAGAERPVGSR